MTPNETQNKAMQFVTFYVGTEKFAIPVTSVREIVRNVKLTKLPLSPNYIEGLTNLRGEVLPIINLRKRLNLEVEPAVSSRIVVVSNNKESFGMLVDKTGQVVDVRDDEFKNSVTNNEFIKEVIHKKEDFYFVINLDKIVDEIHFLRNSKEDSFLSSQPSLPRVSEQEKEDRFTQIITFEINKQTYAIEVNQIQEIIRYRKTSLIPNSENYIDGVIELRHQIIPIIDLKMLFFNQRSSPNNFTKVVIIRTEKSLVGFIVDKINEVLKVPQKDILRTPQMSSSNHEEILGIINSQERLIVLLEPSKLITDKIPEFHKQYERSYELRDIETNTEEEIQLVVFKLCDIDFAVTVESVQEVNKIGKLAHVPNTPDFIEGLMNLRGEILPILNLKNRLSLINCTRSESEKILVYESKGKKLGVIVDSIEGMEWFPKSALVNSSEVWAESSELIPQIVKLPERTLFVIDLYCALSEELINKIPVLAPNDGKIVDGEEHNVQDLTSEVPKERNENIQANKKKPKKQK